MRPTNLTLEERERWAYANGDAHEAKLLGQSVDLAADVEALEQMGTREAVDDAYNDGYEDGRAYERDQG